MTTDAMSSDCDSVSADAEIPESAALSAQFKADPDFTLIQQGAEARLFRCRFLGRDALAKERFAKSYRHPQLDAQLTRDRLKAEVRYLCRCRQLGLDVPNIYFVDSLRSMIIMEYLTDTITTREHINLVLQGGDLEHALLKLDPLAKEIGRLVAVLHRNHLIHGDLTTSNMLLRVPREEGCTPPSVVLLDFGLSTMQQLPEDKAVDLFVLEKAFLSSHPNSEPVFEAILQGYAGEYKEGAAAVLKKLDEVRLRGRKREMVG